MIDILNSKQIIITCLFATLVLVGCSDDDSSSDDNNAATQAAQQNQKNAGKQSANQDESLYSQSLRRERKPTHGDFKNHYTGALDALDKEDYDTAYELLTKAVAGNNNEKLVQKFYGMRVGSYLPHYHLGMIEFLNDDCVTAMAHWDTSLGQGVIQKAREYQYLQAARLQCEPADS